MVHELIQKRRSILAFSDQPVDSATLAVLLEAATTAPSCYNMQPWRFIVACKPDAHYGQLLDCLVPKNQQWAASAPVLTITVTEEVHPERGPNHYAWHDAGLALAALTFQATSMGLFVHPMAGFDAQKARQVFDIPERYAPVAAVAIGYPGNPASLSPENRQRQEGSNPRVPYDQVTFGPRFGQKYFGESVETA